MIGVQYDSQGYSLVCSAKPAGWRLRKSMVATSNDRSSPEAVFCQRSVSASGLGLVSKQLLSKVGYKTSASFCLSPELLERHEFSLPCSFSAKRVHAWVTRHVESWLGEPLANSYFDYAPLTGGVDLSPGALKASRTPADGQLRYILYSIAKPQLDYLLKPLKVAKIDVIRVEVPELCLGRLLFDQQVRCDSLVRGSIMLVDIGPSETYVYAGSREQCRWLGGLKSPDTRGMNRESVEIFISGVQRLIVLLSRSPDVVLLSGSSDMTEAVRQWLKTVLTGSLIQEVCQVFSWPANALLAAASSIH